MAFYDDLARDPKSEEEFWTIIEETFVQVENVLTTYLVETREEALAGTLRGGDFRDTAASIIRYRGVDKDVGRQIKERELTAKFAKDWGVVMMCHGFISAHILDDSDGLSHARAGQLSVEARNTDPQKKWAARQILGLMKPGRGRLTRTLAEARLATKIRELIEIGKFPNGFDEGWFKQIMGNGALRDAYTQKRLTMAQLHELANQPSDDIPPINFSR